MKTKIEKLNNDVIVVGYGRNGKEAVRKLQAYNRLFVVVETNPARIARIKEENLLFVEDDATLDKTLEKAK